MIVKNIIYFMYKIKKFMLVCSLLKRKLSKLYIKHTVSNYIVQYEMTSCLFSTRFRE
jgi:hypothetical protein